MKLLSLVVLVGCCGQGQVIKVVQTGSLSCIDYASVNEILPNSVRRNPDNSTGPYAG